MSEEVDVKAPFKEFAGQNGDYYADTFLNIQKSNLPSTHVNWSAMLGSFVWAALRGNWLLFWIGFVIDLVTLVNVALYFRRRYFRCRDGCWLYRHPDSGNGSHAH